jgi:hypothetical protein
MFYYTGFYSDLAIDILCRITFICLLNFTQGPTSEPSSQKYKSKLHFTAKMLTRRRLSAEIHISFLPMKEFMRLRGSVFTEP